MWVLILARGLKRNATKGVTDVLNDIEDRLFGRPLMRQEITGRDGKDLVPRIEVEIIDKREDVSDENSDD